MKFTVLKALMLPIALLALGSFHNASATTCNASYTLTAVLNPSFSCTIGDLTFSNFAADYSANVQLGGLDGCQSDCPSSPADPSPTSDVTINFNEITNGTQADPFGTSGSTASPVYQVITDYTNSLTNQVSEYQEEYGSVEFVVTDNNAGTSVTQVDGSITGFAMQSDNSSADLDKTLCSGANFPAPTGGDLEPSCPGTSYEVSKDLQLTATNPNTNNDSTLFEAPAFNLTSMDVQDYWDLEGGDLTGGAAQVTEIENDFIETSNPAPSGAPEPSTFLLLGGALVGVGTLRRRKKVA